MDIHAYLNNHIFIIFSLILQKLKRPLLSNYLNNCNLNFSLMQYLVLKEQQLKMLKKKQPRGVLNMKLLLMRYYFLNSLLFLNKYIKIKLFSLVKLK